MEVRSAITLDWLIFGFDTVKVPIAKLPEHKNRKAHVVSRTSLE
jgi:hypothetical protein